MPASAPGDKHFLRHQSVIKVIRAEQKITNIQ